MFSRLCFKYVALIIAIAGLYLSCFIVGIDSIHGSDKAILSGTEMRLLISLPILVVICVGWWNAPEWKSILPGSVFEGFVLGGLIVMLWISMEEGLGGGILGAFLGAFILYPIYAIFPSLILASSLFIGISGGLLARRAADRLQRSD